MKESIMSDFFKRAALISVIIFFPAFLMGQSTVEWRTVYDSVSANLNRLEKSIPGLNQTINISITDATLNEFLRAVAKSSGVNMEISPELTQKVVNNFNNVEISDVLLFLCNQYRLELTSVGNIISIKPFTDPSIPPVCIIEYNDSTGIVTVEADGEELGSLSKKLTLSSGRNVIPAPGLSSQKIKSFILELPFAEALDKIAYSNNLVLKISDPGVFLFEKLATEKPEAGVQRNENGKNYSKGDKDVPGKILIKLLGKDSLSIYAEKATPIDVIKELSDKTGINYLITSLPKGEINVQLTDVTCNNAMNTLLNGSGLVCKKSGNIFIIGDKNTPSLMTQSMIQLQYKSVDSIMAIIPKDIISDVQTIEYREQNSLLLSGPGDKIIEAEKFIRAIDKLVPVISIEVLIIDYSGTNTVSTGIQAGIGSSASTQTKGVIFPAAEIDLSSESINSLISRFNGFGWAKLGMVTPNFYASLKALETQGIVKIRSTPILSTLNGHKAEMSIGETEYYLEESSNIYSTTSTQTLTTQTYKSVNADLSVTITPQVSGDDQITLDVVVEQSDFTERISSTAPPGLVTRKFKAQIRVKNGEMILLGGLEENRQDKTSTGTPFLSRIPIIKWLFASKDDATSKTKLNVFIKPSIIS